MAKTWVVIWTATALWTGCLFGLSMRRSEPTGKPHVATTNGMDARQASPKPAEQPKSAAILDSERVEGPGPSGGGPGPSVMLPTDGAPGDAQIAFVGPDGMTVQWDVGEPGAFDSEPLVIPGRMNFAQGGTYRLKLTNIPGHDGTELYPTIEVGPATPRTEAYAAHAYTPVQFTQEDFDQVMRGNLVTKVIYLPDPEFQGLALAGVETLVSTRLDPSIDPIVEADRRGAILAVVRMGRCAGE
ncbi:MAG: hypothetical protein IID44_26740 [Planctomycetes bacterium]|nr:hypothetical protein [Planctomycetota bacterium]